MPTQGGARPLSPPFMPDELPQEPQSGLGKAVKSLRDKADVYQATLAERAEVPRSLIAELESGRSDPTWGDMRKIAATLSSTGTPALFMHPVEALHGDLGMLAKGDVAIALSASGETEEILELLATIKRLRLPLIAITCDSETLERRVPSPAKTRSQKMSTLASASEVFLSCAVAEEACTRARLTQIPAQAGI